MACIFHQAGACGLTMRRPWHLVVLDEIKFPNSPRLARSAKALPPNGPRLRLRQKVMPRPMGSSSTFHGGLQRGTCLPTAFSVSRKARGIPPRARQCRSSHPACRKGHCGHESVPFPPIAPVWGPEGSSFFQHVPCGLWYNKSKGSFGTADKGNIDQ
jgi:hypothetical protein